MFDPIWSSRRHLITVYPLGGCPMGDGDTKGVVDADGQVFNYPNLYIADGAIVPSALGPNPSKTIGTLAERISEKIIGKGM
ncbi:MAG TPA: GMC family oxidoreductase [Thermodesulfobacteriota bacterium]|nr:GMC family oxidoreductase [Thermodesulfobacteriota bacterium]